MIQEVTMRMKRRLEPVDLIVAVGVFATVLGGCFLYTATSGTLGAATPEIVSIESSARMIDPMQAMEWVQPALGEALVESYLLEQKAAEKITEAVTKLNRATLTGYYLQASPNRIFEQIRSHAAQVEADHAARVQYVLGSSIVAFTGRGVRTGVLSPDRLAGSYNQRMIEIAEATGARIEDNYRKTREPLLGWMIVTASQGNLRLAEQIQERIGKAVAAVTRVQEGFQEAMGSVQEQLASVALASIHTEQIADRFAALASAETRAQAQPVFFSMPRSWPEVSVGLLIAASSALIALFVAGLLLPTYEPKMSAMEEALPESQYRKIA